MSHLRTSNLFFTSLLYPYINSYLCSPIILLRQVQVLRSQSEFLDFHNPRSAQSVQWAIQAQDAEVPWLFRPGMAKMRERGRCKGLPGGSVAKNLPANTGDGDSVPETGRFPWKRKWQPIPVFLPAKSHEPRSLVGCRLWGCKKSDSTEHHHHHQQADARLTTSVTNYWATTMPGSNSIYLVAM